MNLDNVVTGPASLLVVPAGGEPFEGWTPIGFTDSGIQLAPIDARSFARAFDGLSTAMSTLEVTLSDDSVRNLLLLMGMSMAPDETTGPDSYPCEGSGGCWSDLMARIDDLVDGEAA